MLFRRRKPEGVIDRLRTALWPRRSFALRPGVIDVSIGTPVSAVDRQPGELMDEVERWIEAEMRRLDPDAYHA